MGCFVSEPLCPAQASHVQVASSLLNRGASGSPRIARIQFVITDLQGSSGLFKNRGDEGAVVVEVARPSLQRMAYLSGLLIALSLMLAWHCSVFFRNRRRRSAVATMSILDP